MVEPDVSCVHISAVVYCAWFFQLQQADHRSFTDSHDGDCWEQLDASTLSRVGYLGTSVRGPASINGVDSITQGRLSTGGTRRGRLKKAGSWPVRVPSGCLLQPRGDTKGIQQASYGPLTGLRQPASTRAARDEEQNGMI